MINSRRFTHLVLDYTRLCNSRCTYCTIWQVKDCPDLDMQSIENVFADLKSYGLSVCYLTGGEPYLTDKVVEIANLLHKYLPGCRFSGATNAVQPDHILQRLQAIRDLGVPLDVHISINGSEATHDETRGIRGNWRNAVYLLDTLTKWGVNVVASMSLMPQTIKDLPYMQNFCSERGLRLMYSWVRQSPRYGNVDEEQSNWLKPVREKLWQVEYLPGYFDCPGLSERLVVTPEGDVYPCEVYHEEILLGNVKNYSMSEILVSPRTQNIMQMIADKGCYWCQGTGQSDGVPKWMMMDCYRRQARQKKMLAQSVVQAVELPADRSCRLLNDAFLSVSGVEKSSATKPRISVIVCTYRNPQQLSLTIESLLNQVLSPDLYEILVVDNNSGDNTKDIINKYPSVRYVFEEQQGLSCARNKGIHESQGDIVAFIDDDAEASPIWLSTLLDVFNDMPDVLSAGGKVLPIWDAPKPDWLTEDYYPSLSLIDLGESQRNLQWPEKIIGVNCSFKKEIFSSIGYFDNSLGRTGDILLGNEDTEIQQRIHGMGYKVLYTPQALVFHHVPAERMTHEYFVKRLVGTEISQNILKYRAEGRHSEIDKFTEHLQSSFTSPGKIEGVSMTMHQPTIPDLLTSTSIFDYDVIHGNVYYKIRNYSLASDCYSKALQNASLNEEQLCAALIGLAKCRLELKDYPSALDLFAKAMHQSFVKPYDKVQSILEFCWLLDKHGLNAEAESLYTLGTLTDGLVDEQRYDLYVRLANARWKKGDVDASAIYYRNGLNIVGIPEKRKFFPLLGLGKCLAMRKEYAEALACFNEAVSKPDVGKENQALATVEISACKKAMGDLTEAQPSGNKMDSYDITGQAGTVRDFIKQPASAISVTADASYATVRDYNTFLEKYASLTFLSGDLKNFQRPWVIDAVLRQTPRGGRVLEIGADKCELADLLQKLGYEVWVIDVFDEYGGGVAKFEEVSNRFPNIRFVRGFIHEDKTLPGNYFDAIYSCSVIEHNASSVIPLTYDRIHQCLKKGGKSIHAIDFTVDGLVLKNHGLIDAVLTWHGLPKTAEQIGKDALDDIDTYYLSPQGHYNWRKFLCKSYDEYPFRKVTSLNIVSTLN